MSPYMLDHRGRPAASAINRTIDAVDSVNKFQTTFPGGEALPWLYAAIGAGYCYLDEDYEEYPVGSGHYRLIDGAIPQNGTGNDGINIVHDWADSHFPSQVPEFYSGIGWVDRTGCTGADLLYIGSGRQTYDAEKPMIGIPGELPYYYYPYVMDFATPSWPTGYNFFGSGYGGKGGSGTHWDWSSAIVIEGGFGVTYPEWFRHAPEGTVINSARLEVKCAGLEYYANTITQTSYSDTPTITAEETTTTFDGLALIAAEVDSTHGTVYQWGEIGVVGGGEMASDLWSVVDATALATALLSEANTKRCRFGMLPSISASAFFQSDMRGFLGNALTNKTWAWDSTAHKVYCSESSGFWLTWTGVEIGTLDVDFTYPSGENGRVVIGGNWPRMD